MSTLNEYKEKQLVEKLNRMKVSNLSKEDIIKSFSRQELELIKSEFKNLEDVIEKSHKAATIGEIRDWNGKKYKKQPNGKWLEVSEHGMTKKEHEDLVREHGKKMSESRLIEAKVESKDQKFHFDEEQKHLKERDQLSNKEHSDEEVGLGEKKEEGSLVSGILSSSTRLNNQFDKLREELKKKGDDLSRFSKMFEEQVPVIKNILKKYKNTEFNSDNAFLDKFITDDCNVLRIYLKTGLNLDDKKRKKLEEDLRENGIPFSIGSPSKSGDIDLVYYDK